MHKLYCEFLKLLEKEDRKGCIEFVQSKLLSGEIDVITLYNELLKPSLSQMEYKEDEKKYGIWKEHARSSIIRTILENCYQFVMKERDAKRMKNGGKVVVACPQDEYHEIGARMVVDFFTICGFDVTFIGANTPVPDFLAGVEYLKPRFICISISNYYNLVATGKLIPQIKGVCSPNTKIIVGGRAFDDNPDAYKQIGADMRLSTFDDIFKLANEVT